MREPLDDLRWWQGLVAWQTLTALIVCGSLTTISRWYFTLPLLDIVFYSAGIPMLILGWFCRRVPNLTTVALTAGLVSACTVDLLNFIAQGSSYQTILASPTVLIFVLVPLVMGHFTLNYSRKLFDPDPALPVSATSLNCAVCGYSLVGLPEQRCPECGTPFAGGMWAGIEVHS